MDISFGGPIFGARGPRGTGPLSSLGARRRTRASLAKRCQTAAEYTGVWGWTVALGVSASAAAGRETEAPRRAEPAAGARATQPSRRSADSATAPSASSPRPGTLLHTWYPADPRTAGDGHDPLDLGLRLDPCLGGGDPRAALPRPAALRDDPACCRCRRPHCPAPGLHPLGVGRGLDGSAPEKPAELPPGADLADAQNAWAPAPDAPLLLPVGRSFDLLDVPEPAGHRALARLERMGTRLGPVLATPAGRVLFFVAPGATAALPELLYKTGWDDAGLDLLGHGPGAYVAVPPTVLPGLGSPEWLLPPSDATARQLPEARLLLGTLAYACHRGHDHAAGHRLLDATAGWGATG